MRFSLRWLFVAILLVAVCVVPVPVRGEVVEYQFAGRVTRTHFPVYGILPDIGAPITGRFSYDTAATQDSDPSISFYAAYILSRPLGFTAYLDNRIIENQEVFVAYVINDIGGNVQDVFNIGGESIIDGVATRANFAVEFWSTDRGMLQSLRLPDALSAFNYPNVETTAVLTAGNSDLTIVCAIDSLIPIPSPSAGLLAIVGILLVFLCGMIHRRVLERC